jgi:hypothetical protein
VPKQAPAASSLPSQFKKYGEIGKFLVSSEGQFEAKNTRNCIVASLAHTRNIYVTGCTGSCEMGQLSGQSENKALRATIQFGTIRATPTITTKVVFRAR